MSESSENSIVCESQVQDPETYWIFNSEAKKCIKQQLATDFPILETMLEELGCHSDIAILRRIASNAMSPELEESVNTAISIIVRSMGHPREKVKKLRKKFNRLIKGTLFINIINDIALKTEMEIELLESESAGSI